MLDDIKKSILSGLLIAVGGSVYMACRTINCGSINLTWLGAILFSAGLFTICVYGFNLYTGKVGYIGYKLTDGKYIGFVGLVLFFNLLTTFLLGIVIAYTYPKIGEEAFKVYTPKLSMHLLKVLVSGTFCGLLMFLAVDTWKQGKIIGCFIYVPTFIFAGFDHSIANSFYNGAAWGHQLFTESSFLFNNTESFHVFSMANLLFTVVTVIGNAIGGMLVPLLTRSWKKESED